MIEVFWRELKGLHAGYIKVLDGMTQSVNPSKWQCFFQNRFEEVHK